MRCRFGIVLTGGAQEEDIRGRGGIFVDIYTLRIRIRLVKGLLSPGGWTRTSSQQQCIPDANIEGELKEHTNAN
jgi:hypothetical protein